MSKHNLKKITGTVGTIAKGQPSIEAPAACYPDMPLRLLLRSGWRSRQAPLTPHPFFSCNSSLLPPTSILPLTSPIALSYYRQLQLHAEVDLRAITTRDTQEFEILSRLHPWNYKPRKRSR
jgi:hypothetical protein